MKKVTTEEFIIKAKKIHGNKYDYSLSIYIKSCMKIKIICLIHGIFEQTPNGHLQGYGCDFCGGSATSLKDEFITQANIIHNNYYTYEKVLYKNRHTKVEIICPTHGSFFQEPNSHLYGGGCSGCSNTKKYEIQLFLNKSKLIHNNYYTYDKVVLKKSTDKICITCPSHGDFLQQANLHLYGSGCPKCHHDKKPELFSKGIKKFIEEANTIHDNFYTYTEVMYKNMKTKIKIICPIHGIFEQTPDSHLRGCGCSKCNFSQGENIVEQYLLNNKILYITQKRFLDCKYKRVLPFDFYLPELNIFIEYNGIQHYKEVSYWHQRENSSFEIQKLKDNIKKEYAEANGIFIEIKYSDKIEEILDTKLKEWF